MKKYGGQKHTGMLPPPPSHFPPPLALGKSKSKIWVNVTLNYFESSTVYLQFIPGSEIYKAGSQAALWKVDPFLNGLHILDPVPHLLCGSGPRMEEDTYFPGLRIRSDPDLFGRIRRRIRILSVLWLGMQTCINKGKKLSFYTFSGKYFHFFR